MITRFSMSNVVWKTLLWQLAFYLVIISAKEGDEELLDFDFGSLKEIDWNYNGNDNERHDRREQLRQGNSQEKQQLHLEQQLDEPNAIFSHDVDENENQVNPFSWRERILRIALSKALTNKALRQKFIEVMPILRVLSSQQRVALSALISAQVNARQGQELKLEQVRLMFGDDKKLLLPIVYDIANLVRNSARTSLKFDNKILASHPVSQRHPQASNNSIRRVYELTSNESESDTSGEEQNIDTVSHAKPEANDDKSLEDFFVSIPVEVEDVLDAKRINEELQEATTGISELTTKKTTTQRQVRQRRRRSTEFVHKLIRSIPLSVNEDDLLKGAAGRTVKLNTTAFFMPHPNVLHRKRATTSNGSPEKTSAIAATATAAAEAITIVTPSSTTSSDDVQYEKEQQQQPQSQQSHGEFENRIDSGFNHSQVNSSSSPLLAVNGDGQEPLPSPEELIAGPRYRFGILGGAGLNRVRPKGVKLTAKRKRVQLRPRPHESLLAQPSSVRAPSVLPKKCERFTSSMCLRADDYPLEQIMGSIRRHKNAMPALLAEYYDDIGDVDTSEEFEEYPYSKKRREDEENDGKSGMCSSTVRYARPQKARSAAGEWKYIVNTGQHTQTLRMEKCTTPQESCSYLAHNYRSRCAQVYNYHRLLSWDKTRGLHVDIFKVPTCCSCQIDGYRQQFPPLANAVKSKDFTPAYKGDLYTTIGDEFDYREDDDDDIVNLPQHYIPSYKKSKLSHSALYDPNELQMSSKKVRTHVFAPAPTVGAYLSPPSAADYASELSYQRQRNTGSGGISQNLLHQSGSSRRRPYTSLMNEDRVDLEIAPSEPQTDKEVNIFDRSDDSTIRVQPQRKRIYSVPHTASSTGDNTNEHGDPGSSVQLAPPLPTYYAPSSASISSSAKFSNGNGPGQGKNKNNKSTNNNNNRNTVGTSRFPAPISSHISSASTFIAFRPTSTSSSATSPFPLTETPPGHHVNSVFSSKYGGGIEGSVMPSNTKRVNYNYHPIIDFFENNTRPAEATAKAALPVGSSSIINPSGADLVYRHTIPNATPLAGHLPPTTLYHSRQRIGYGRVPAEQSSSSWQPVAMGS